MLTDSNKHLKRKKLEEGRKEGRERRREEGKKRKRSWGRGEEKRKEGHKEITEILIKKLKLNWLIMI